MVLVSAYSSFQHLRNVFHDKRGDKRTNNHLIFKGRNTSVNPREFPLRCKSRNRTRHHFRSRLLTLAVQSVRAGGLNMTYFSPGIHYKLLLLSFLSVYTSLLKRKFSFPSELSMTFRSPQGIPDDHFNPMAQIPSYTPNPTCPISKEHEPKNGMGESNKYHRGQH